MCRSARHLLEYGTVIHFRFTVHSCGVFRGSSVGIATRQGLYHSGINFRWGRDCPHPSRPAVGPTPSPVQWVLGLYARGWRWPPTPIYPLSYRNSRAVPLCLHGRVQGDRHCPLCAAHSHILNEAVLLTFMYSCHHRYSVAACPGCWLTASRFAGSGFSCSQHVTVTLTWSQTPTSAALSASHAAASRTFNMSSNLL